MLQNLQLLLFLHRPETLKGSSIEKFFRCSATNNTVAYRQLKTGITEISTKGGGMVWVNPKPTFRNFGIWGNFFSPQRNFFIGPKTPRRRLISFIHGVPPKRAISVFFTPRKRFFGVLNQQRECLNKCF